VRTLTHTHTHTHIHTQTHTYTLRPCAVGGLHQPPLTRHSFSSFTNGTHSPAHSTQELYDNSPFAGPHEPLSADSLTGVRKCVCVCVCVSQFTNHTHTHTPMRTHTHSHMHIHIHTHSHMQTHIHIHIHTCKHAYTYSIHTHTHTHTLTYTCKLTHTHSRMQTLTHTLTHTHTHTHMQTHTRTHTHTLKHASSHTHKHTHTQTHTHANSHKHTHADHPTLASTVSVPGTSPVAHSMMHTGWANNSSDFHPGHSLSHTNSNPSSSPNLPAPNQQLQSVYMAMAAAATMPPTTTASIEAQINSTYGGHPYQIGSGTPLGGGYGGYSTLAPPRPAAASMPLHGTHPFGGHAPPPLPPFAGADAVSGGFLPYDHDAAAHQLDVAAWMATGGMGGGVNHPSSAMYPPSSPLPPPYPPAPTPPLAAGPSGPGGVQVDPVMYAKFMEFMESQNAGKGMAGGAPPLNMGFPPPSTHGSGNPHPMMMAGGNGGGVSPTMQQWDAAMRGGGGTAALAGALCKHALTRTLTCTHALALVHTHMHTRNTHACAHSHAHALALVHTHMHTRNTHAHTHMHTRLHTHAHSHKHMNPHANTHTQTHTHTHTHTTRIPTSTAAAAAAAEGGGMGPYSNSMVGGGGYRRGGGMQGQMYNVSGQPHPYSSSHQRDSFSSGSSMSGTGQRMSAFEHVQHARPTMGRGPASMAGSSSTDDHHSYHSHHHHHHSGSSAHGGHPRAGGTNANGVALNHGSMGGGGRGGRGGMRRDEGGGMHNGQPLTLLDEFKASKAHRCVGVGVCLWSKAHRGCGCDFVWVCGCVCGARPKGVWV